jgi:hypothetical protein
LSDPVPVEDEVPTVGNRLAGFVGEIPVPAIVGVALGTAIGVSGVVGLVVGLLVTAATSSVAVLESGSAPIAHAVAVRNNCSPAGAWDCTCTCASISSACPTGRLPIVQIVPLAVGQTLKVGEPMFSVPGGNVAVTLTFALAAPVLHTQMTKLATLPGVT